MKEKENELYQKYLEEKLDLIFQRKKEQPKNESIKEKHFRVIEKEGKYNFIDENEKLLSSIWFDNAKEFEDGYAIVTKIIKVSGKYGKEKTIEKDNLIDTNGKLVSNEWYDAIGYFHDGYAWVKKNGKYNYIDTNGKLIGNKWYIEADDFDCGIACVTKRHAHFEYAGMGYKIDHEMYNIINTKGEVVFKKWFDNPIYIYEELNKSFACLCSSYRLVGVMYIPICLSKNLKDYEVKKFLTGYTCTNGKDKFNIKYQPLRIYDSRNILCTDGTHAYLFDRSLGKYTQLCGTISVMVEKAHRMSSSRHVSILNIEFDENFIFDHENKKVYFVYEGQIHDITEYYNKKLKYKENIPIKKGINVLSKNDFFYQQEEKIKKETEKERKEKELAKIRANETEEERRLRELKKQNEVNQKEQDIRMSEAFRSIKQGVKVLEKYAQENKKIEKIQVSNLFVNVNTHKEINPMYIELGLLKYIDLSMVSFKNVKISGIDFRGCNIQLNPQEVFEKDLRGCNFEGLFIAPFMDFTGVDIRGARFSKDNDPKTVDLGSVSFANSIYDDSTMFEGIPFTIMYDKEKKVK